MAISAARLAELGKYGLDHHLANNPIDQIAKEKPFLKALMGNKKPTVMGSQWVVEQIRTSYASNFQWYDGNDQVTYNSKDTIDQTNFSYGSVHDGFYLDEDELVRNGITVNDEVTEPMTESEKNQLTALFKDNIETLRLGFDESLDYQLHLDGTQDAQAVAGLDFLVSSDGLGTVGGIDASTATYWRNQFDLTLTSADMLEKMELQMTAIKKYGGRVGAIFMGPDFYAAFRVAARADIAAYTIVRTSGQTRSLDPSITNLHFHGVPIVLDHTVSDIETATPGTPNWNKRCYFIDTRHLTYKPIKGHEMISRKPPREYDRYVHYWALTHKFLITMNKRCVHSIMALV